MEVIKVPSTWCSDASSVQLRRSENEFVVINQLFCGMGYTLRSLCRNQDPHRYSLFKVRQQFLTMCYHTKMYYERRMYVSVPNDLVDLALKHHLDPRRCDHDFIISDTIHVNRKKRCVFIVCVTTYLPHAAEFAPVKDSDYFIEYVAYV